MLLILFLPTLSNVDSKVMAGPTLGILMEEDSWEFLRVEFHSRAGGGNPQGEGVQARLLIAYFANATHTHRDQIQQLEQKMTLHGLWGRVHVRNKKKMRWQAMSPWKQVSTEHWEVTRNILSEYGIPLPHSGILLDCHSRGA